MIEYGLYRNILENTVSSYYIVLDKTLGIYCFVNANSRSEFGANITEYGYEKIEEYTC